MNMKIRKFKQNDAEDLAKLDIVWKKERISLGMLPRTPKEFIKDCRKGICFVAEFGNKMIGYVLGQMKIYKGKKLFYLKRGERYINLDSLYVLKSYRESGAGKILIKSLIKEAKKLGFNSIHLVADAKEQEKLIALYKSCGFQFVFTRMKLDLK